MKKTLIALAAVAAVGTSFAQVSITGKLGYSVQSNPVAGAAKVKGMAISDGDINFAAVEDLGGGMKASVLSAIKARGRGNNSDGRNATLTLSSNDVVITAGAIEVGSTLTNAWVSAPASFASGPDNDTVLDGYSNVDILSVTLPLGAMSLSASYIDTNLAGSATQITSVGATFNTGGLSLTADMANYANAATAAVDGLTRSRATLAYNFGPASVGVGFQSKNKGIAAQTAFGITAPLGALTVGLTYSMRAAQAISADAGITAAAAERTGTTLGATYSLSKTTSLYGGYATYTGISTDDNEYRIRLLKSF